MNIHKVDVLVSWVVYIVAGSRYVASCHLYRSKLSDLIKVKFCDEKISSLCDVKSMQAVMIRIIMVIFLYFGYKITKICWVHP